MTSLPVGATRARLAGSPAGALRESLRRAIPAVACLLALAGGAASQQPAAQPSTSAQSPPAKAPSLPSAAVRPTADQVMATLATKFRQDDKKFAALAQSMDKAVRAAIDKTTWLEAADARAVRAYKQHPLFTLIGELSDAAKAEAGKRKAPSPEAQKLIAKYPWLPRLELVQGLDYGSDRPIPEHENGFISLGSATAFPGYPDLPVNQYLYGLGEIVGWQYRVKAGKKIEYEGRSAKDGPVMATVLPSWGQIDVYLQGSLPEVPLFAIPRLTHEIHCRLAERRRTAGGAATLMDDSLAFMDSRWNGFSFLSPYTRERVAIGLPVHALYTDNGGFVFQFPVATKYAKSGDIPFMSVVAIRSYGESFDSQGGKLRDGSAADQFSADSRYLARYKTLIDEIVRAVLAPNLPYPRYMANVDFPQGKAPAARESGTRTGLPRDSALVLWAFAEKDPAKVADFLYDNLLAKDANAFPNDVPLQFELANAVRDHEAEMLQAIGKRIANDRGEANLPGDYEREFSPYPTYLELDGTPTTNCLVQSFESFHARATSVIQDAAYAVAAKETVTH